MCKHSIKKKDLKYEEIPGPPFTLSGGVVDEKIKPPSTKSVSSDLFIFELKRNSAKISLSPRSKARRTALNIAESTGNPVVVAEFLGVSAVKKNAILRKVGMVRTTKADPLSVESLDDWSAELARDLESVAAAEISGMVDGVSDLLAFDYAAAGTARFEAMQSGLAARLGIPPAEVASAQQIILTERLSGVIQSVGSAMAKQPKIRGTIGASLSLPGKEIGSLMSRFHGFFVRDQYGRVSQSLGRQAVNVINRGLADGLGRGEIGRNLRNSISGGLRMRGYWETVAANAVGHARSYSQGASMRSAGIEFFKVVAVMDDVTSDICLYLNDKVIPVGGAMALMDRQLSAESPEGYMDAHPMTRQNGDRVFQSLSDGTERDILRVVGPQQYALAFPASQLVDASIGLPPYHHRCRSTFVAA